MPHLAPDQESDPVATILTWLHEILSSGLTECRPEQLLKLLHRRFRAIGAGLRFNAATTTTLPSIEYWEAGQRPADLENPWDDDTLSQGQTSPLIMNKGPCSWLLAPLDEVAFPDAIL